MKSRPKPAKRSKPADAKAALTAVLGDPQLFFDPRFVKDDLMALRRVFAQDDDGYAEAVKQTALEIVRAQRKPLTYGEDLGHDLSGWRRSKYASTKGGEADLRLVFRKHDKQLEILVFGRRRSFDPEGLPATPYHVAAKRR